MSYLMHRVFYAATDHLEAECEAFYQVLGDFNEKEAMPHGILFVPVSLLPTMTDKRPFQAAIDDNIRSCRYYVLVLDSNWGSPQRSFTHDCELAIQCAANPALPMQEVVLLLKKSPAGIPGDLPDIEALKFSTLEEYKQHWRLMLDKWLRSIL